jgi:AraC family transcriptional regulator of adaptative response / DNA-3-methyladenine glycosylase II
MSPARSATSTSRAELVDALDRELCYRALRTRDARFDGRFFTAVISTGIYCRPVCPARTPKLENCLFVPSAAAAQSLGFRPCLRCRPEAAPGAAIGRGSANTVARALHLIASGSLGQGGLDEFAERLGLGTRQLRRLFDRHVGASPVTVAQTQRLLFAKQLLLETDLPLAQVAGAAGFGSVRRFNAVFQNLYARTPSQLRRVPTRRAARRTLHASREPSPPESNAHEATHEPTVQLKLPYTPPYDFAAMLEFLEHRSIPGVEAVHAGRYLRAFALDGAFGTLEVRALPDRPQLSARIRCTDISALRPIVARLRRMFDLDADSTAIDGQLARHPALAQRVLARPGIRVPGAWDGFELAVRALLGQQVSVAAATTFADRIVQRYGSELPQNARMHEASAVTRLFPTPDVLAKASFEGIGLTRARCAALQGLARHVAEDARCLQPAASLAASVERLCRLPGIGEWTAHYIALRALGEPDAFPVGDLGLARALADDGERPNARELSVQAEVFRPFRAYATLRLWLQPQTSAKPAAST